jgi:hypothetical protein
LIERGRFGVLGVAIGKELQDICGTIGQWAARIGSYRPEELVV